VNKAIEGWKPLTFGISLVRKVSARWGARHKGCPESSTNLSLLEAGEIHMGLHSSLREGDPEFVIIDVVVEQEPDQNGKVIMSICITGTSIPR
jgi:hypothetical protein